MFIITTSWVSYYFLKEKSHQITKTPRLQRKLITSNTSSLRLSQVPMPLRLAKQELEVAKGIRRDISTDTRKKKSNSKAITGRSMPQKILSFERQKPESTEDVSKKQTAKSPQGAAARIRKEIVVDSFIFEYLTEIDWIASVISAQNYLVDAPIFPNVLLYMRGVITNKMKRSASL
jgi:hypothetical protein